MKLIPNIATGAQDNQIPIFKNTGQQALLDVSNVLNIREGDDLLFSLEVDAVEIINKPHIGDHHKAKEVVIELEKKQVDKNPVASHIDHKLRHRAKGSQKSAPKIQVEHARKPDTDISHKRSEHHPVAHSNELYLLSRLMSWKVSKAVRSVSDKSFPNVFEHA